MRLLGRTHSDSLGLTRTRSDSVALPRAMICGRTMSWNSGMCRTTGGLGKTHRKRSVGNDAFVG